MIDVRDATVAVSHLPQKLPGSARVNKYTFTLNEKGDNISSEAERIKAEILQDSLLVSLEAPIQEAKTPTEVQA
jgi:hypothetical protein